MASKVNPWILQPTLSTLQVSWARAFGHFVFILAAFLPRQGLAVLRTKRPMIQFGRALMLYISNLCFFFAIVFIPIADAAAISMTAPLVVALLAWPMLGERTNAARLVALAPAGRTLLPAHNTAAAQPERLAEIGCLFQLP